ncbi:MAG: transporter substrate-binding domain-containing protein [Paraglaciecola sp.]|uniref:substrate-binding periplasmic protein n=1 Tax=Paraglaciecola sp. TaxID=1920173 RepID=UPI0032985E7D
MRFKKRLVYWFCLLFLIFLVSHSHQSAAQSGANKGKVKLATGAGYSPFVDSKLPEGGWSASLVKQTFSKMNLLATIEVLPWNRALKWTQEGKFLAAFPFVYSKSRAESFLYSTAINFVPVHMYVASNSQFTSPEQLRNKRLCFPFSYSLDSLEQGIVDKYQMTINRVKDGIGCIKHVQKGWSDAGLTNGYIHAEKLPKNDVSGVSIVIFPEQLALVPLYLLISKDYANAQQWVEEFNYAFGLLQKSGEQTATQKMYLELIDNLRISTQ